MAEYILRVLRASSFGALFAVSSLMCLPTMVKADEISDWQDTVNEIRRAGKDPGCGSLHWVGGESYCNSANVHSLCDKPLTYRSSDTTCDKMQSDAEGLVLKQREELIRGLKANKEKLASADPSQKNEWEDKIKKNLQDLAKNDSDIEDLKRALSNGQTNRESCLTARDTVGKLFMTAAEKADQVPDASLAKKNARECAIIWKYSHNAHMEARVNVRMSIDNCKEGLRIIDKKSSY